MHVSKKVSIQCFKQAKHNLKKTHFPFFGIKALVILNTFNSTCRITCCPCIVTDGLRPAQDQQRKALKGTKSFSLL